MNQRARRLATLLVASPLALCRRVREAIAGRTRMGLQGLLSRRPRLKPTRLPVLGAKMRTGTTPKLTQGERAKPTPVVVRDHGLSLVRPGHADFAKTAPESRTEACASPQLPSKPQPEAAPGETQVAPSAQRTRGQ